MEWISVKDRSPEEGYYLGYIGKNNIYPIGVHILYYHADYKRWDTSSHHNVPVTHWMPLPSPPEEAHNG